MKVLSLLQPWATLVVLGAKKFETRSWATRHRGPLLIHASKKFTHENMFLCYRRPFCSALAPVWDSGSGDMPSEKLPTGAIIGQVDLVNCITTEEWLKQNSITLSYESSQEYQFGDYSDGRRAWELQNPKMLENPLQAIGSLGFWDFPIETFGPLSWSAPQPQKERTSDAEKSKRRRKKRA